MLIGQVLLFLIFLVIGRCFNHFKQTQTPNFEINEALAAKHQVVGWSIAIAHDFSDGFINPLLVSVAHPQKEPDVALRELHVGVWCHNRKPPT